MIDIFYVVVDPEDCKYVMAFLMPEKLPSVIDLRIIFIMPANIQLNIG